jgi:Tfp pilus assembly protein PilO
MISFRTRDDSVAAAIAILAILILTGALGVLLFVPNPTEAGITRGRPRMIANLQREVADLKKESAAITMQIEPLLWDASVAQIAPQALASINRLAASHKVQILAFRPQKPIETTGLTLMPFSLTVDGSYPNVMQVVKDLDKSNLKLAVGLVQVGASDGATDHVTGTINIVAYMKTATVKTTPKVATTTTTGGTDAKKPK